MKQSSPRSRPLSHAKAKNAALLNLLATPGLGSLLCRRWIAGTGQLLLAIAGFALVFAFFVNEMIEYYGQITGDVKVRPVGWMLESGSIVFATAWLWSAITSFGLLREASSRALQSLENQAAPPLPKLDEAGIIAALALLPHWARQGTAISRTYQFKNFPEAVNFVNPVAAVAEEAWHHPDIDIRWNKATLTLTTHDAGGLTQKDFELARQFDKLKPET